MTPPFPAPVDVWGVPFTPITLAQVVDWADAHIAGRGAPEFFVTANLHYAMLTAEEPRLREVNRRAKFVVADGMPIVWWSRWQRRPLPQRVAGSDLIYALCERAAARGYRVFFLGGAPGVGDEAARRLTERYPGLRVAGVESPPFRPLTAEEHEALLGRVRSARPDLFIGAFSMPQGELWLAENVTGLGAPVCVQLGAALDFAAGRARRAPRWMQRTGLEWAYRFWREPRRLAGRYLRNAAFLARAVTARPTCPSARPPSRGRRPRTSPGGV